MGKIIKIAAQVVLAAIIVWLAYLCYDSIRVPQEFKMIKERRYEAIIERLKDIRSAQEAYKQTYNYYAPNFDSLINFVKYDSVKSVRSIGELTDEQIEAGMTELEAIKKGFIMRDTVRTPTLEYLTRTEVGINGKEVKYEFNTKPEDLRWVPAIKKKIEFNMEAITKVTDRGSEIPLFQACISDNAIFEDMVGTKYQNAFEESKWEAFRMNRYVGLKVGDINEPNGNVGNWQ